MNKMFLVFFFVVIFFVAGCTGKTIESTVVGEIELPVESKEIATEESIPVAEPVSTIPAVAVETVVPGSEKENKECPAEEETTVTIPVETEQTKEDFTEETSIPKETDSAEEETIVDEVFADDLREMENGMGWG